jgi:nucleoid-associated protein YgaU
VPHTETPDPNRTSLTDNGASRRREEGAAGPATRPGGSDRGQASGGAQAQRNDETASGGATALSGPKKRVVKSGESYWTIAKDEYGSAVYVSHLIRANPGIDPRTLKAGATITVPPRSDVVPAGVTERTLAGGNTGSTQVDPAKQYRVQSGDNLSVISKKLYGRADRVDEIYELNKDVIGPNKSALKRDMVLVLPEPPTTRQGG